MTDVTGKSIVAAEFNATEVKTGVAEGIGAIDKFENKVVSSADKVGKAFDGTGKSVTEATDKIDSATKRYIASVEREIATLTLSRSEYRQWEAQVKGIPASVYTPLVAKMEEAKAATDRLTAATAAQAKQDQQAAANASFIKGLESRASAIGKTQSEILAMQAAQMGLTAQAAPFIAKLKEQETALKKSGIQFNEYGRSVKQVEAGLRQVPAQITDIIVSLQGGQAPLTVLLQQGGQLKDVFGGVVPAAKALGGAILGLVNPYTLVASAVASLAFVYYKASQQADAFNTSIISSGNFAGQSASGLAQSATAVGEITGRFGVARDAAAALAAQGNITGQQMRIALQGVVSGTVVTGKSVDDLVKSFGEIAKDPVAALTKLNEQYNFLTVSTLAQIRALKEQNRDQEAATLGFNIFADTLNNRRAEVEKNYGFFQRLGRTLAETFSEIGDSLLNIGAPPNLARDIAVAQNQLRSMLQTVGPGGATPGSRAEREIQAQVELIAGLQRQVQASNDAAAAEGRRQVVQKEGTAGYEAAARTADQYADKATKLKKVLDDYRDSVAKGRKAALERGEPIPAELSDSVVAKTIAGIRKSFEDKSRPKAVTDNEATRLLLRLKETEAALKAQLEVDDKLGVAAQARIKFEAEIAELKEKRVLTADQKSLLAAQDAILAQLRKNELIENEVKGRQEAIKEAERLAKLDEQFAQRAAQLQEEIASARDTRQEARGRVLGAFGRSDQTNTRVNAENDLEREFQRRQQQLIRSTPKELLGSDKYIAEMVKIKAALDQAREDQAQYYRDLEVLQSNWINGATKALETYYDNTKDIAGQTEQVFTNALKGIEDAFVTLAATGKLSFKDLANSVIADIYRIILRAQITGPLAKALQDTFGGSGGGGGGSGLVSAIGNFLGGLFGRDTGGTVEAGKSYRVTESSPEMLEVKGKQYLMMGGASGKITPMPRATGGDVRMPASLARDVVPTVNVKSSDVQVNVYNNAPNTKVTETETAGPGGIRQRNIMIDQVDAALAGRIRSGNGKTAQALTQVYGLNRASGATQ